MDQQQIINDIRQYIETNILSGDIKINADTVLQDAGIDSFSIVEIILFIERKYGVAITDDKLVPENFRTLESLSLTVLELMKQS
ncbi:MAG: acyl carrier protein [Chitinophagaceae bacterium]|nr:acyl carrier protein [Chitinophagaceae bacterium]